MTRFGIIIGLWICFTCAAFSQETVPLKGKPEGMVQALSGSAQRFGCAASVDVNIPNILFENDRADLTPLAQDQMDVLALALRDHKFRHDSFVIEGHASAPGTQPHNKILSEHRAQRVMGAMAARDVKDHRLSWRAYGERRLLYLNHPDHADNRRVTIRRIAAGSALREALIIANRDSHELSYRLMVSDINSSWWAQPKDVIERSMPVYLCVSSNRNGLLQVEIREEGQDAFETVGTWPLPEGGLVRVPNDRDFIFTGTPRWQEIRLRHIDCARATCPNLSSGT